MKEIRKALKAFGERSENITVSTTDDLGVVYVDNEYFGIYSFTKNTFVD